MRFGHLGASVWFILTLLSFPKGRVVAAAPAAVLAFLVIAIWPLQAGSLSGTWVLNRQRSEFGTGPIPDQMVVRIEERAGVLLLTEFTRDDSGDYLTRRQIPFPQCQGHSHRTERCSRSHVSIEAETELGHRHDEWDLTSAGDLILCRSWTATGAAGRQRLVFRPTQTLWTPTGRSSD